MESNKRDVYLLIGVALLVIAAVVGYKTFNKPVEYTVAESTTVAIATTAQEITVNNNNVSVSYPINLNTATFDELISVDGIGEKRANDILAYRNSIGKFSSVEQLKNIKGIGEASYQKVAGYFTV